MSFKKLLSKETGLPEELLPSGYQMIGDIIILNLKNNVNEELISKAVHKLVPSAKTICVKTGIIKGEYREPQVRKIWGEDTITIHKEHGCKFMIDVTKVMWAKGNLHERIRIAKLINKNDKVLDMFAGIGYFTIPIAVHNKQARIISIEKNPIAYELLIKNIRLNKISNVKPILGDSMIESLKYKDWATRIIMGYIPEPREFLKSAFTAINEGFIHYEGVRRVGEEETLFNPVKSVGEKMGYSCELINTQIVKSYGPKRNHVVVDVRVKRNI